MPIGAATCRVSGESTATTLARPVGRPFGIWPAFRLARIVASEISLFKCGRMTYCSATSGATRREDLPMRRRAELSTCPPAARAGAIAQVSRRFFDIRGARRSQPWGIACRGSAHNDSEPQQTEPAVTLVNGRQSSWRATQVRRQKPGHRQNDVVPLHCVFGLRPPARAMRMAFGRPP